ncbi:MAG: hypothetical protein Q7W51_05835 [Coriobacteriia bacterium]|nr:hypothetical protein [Coriobacteriia bacterium]
MADEYQATDEVKKSRKGLVGALVALALVVGGTGLMYATGFGPFAPDEAEVVETKPVETEEAEEEADDEVTPVASPATVPLPPAEAQEVMYWEQVASATTIDDLVNNQFVTFELTEVVKSTELANIRVKATYHDGDVMNGWLVLKSYEGAWYFQSITADGHTVTTPDLGTPDADVLKAIVEQQAANQDVYTAILDGTYNKFTVDTIVVGSGAKTINITLSGPTKTGDAAKVACISKDGGTGTQWFITGFTK